MRRQAGFLIVLVVISLNMGASCRQETAQSVASTFFNSIAQAAGQAIVQGLVNDLNQ